MMRPGGWLSPAPRTRRSNGHGDCGVFVSSRAQVTPALSALTRVFAPPESMGRISINMANKKAYYVSSSKRVIDQHLTQAHMTSHYNRILSAKASVDCSVPKSMQLSVKYQDQLQRQNRKTQNRKGFISARSESWSSSGSSGRLTSTEHIQNPSILEHDDTRCLTNGCMTPNRTIASAQEFSILPSTPSIDKEAAQKIFTMCYSDLSPRTSTSSPQHYKTFCSSSASLANSQHCYRSFQDARQKTYSGDVLEKHAHRFTDGQRFSPRILKKEAQSFLAHYRYYTPVKKKKLSKKNLVTQETQTDFNSSQDASSLENKKCCSHLTSSQAKYNKQICSEYEEDRNDYPHNLDCEKLQESFECPYHNCVPSLSSTNRIKSPIMRKVKAEEEELRYLEFISDVTSEILTRGLFSNRVLESIFERRIEENKHRLDEQKLRFMLDELKEDLDCKSEKNQRTSGNETLFKEPKIVELNNCNSSENPNLAHNWKEDTGITANISIDTESDKTLDHRLNGIFSTDVCCSPNNTGNKCCHDICGEHIEQVQDLEQDRCLISNCVDHSGHFTDYAADLHHAADLTEIDNLAVSLHSVNVKEHCESEDAQVQSGLSNKPETAFDDGINLLCL
ncbi:spermatogenesis-associated protein 7 homolog [Pristis pectinata]|uniref:spermatogenesis-associated protein 7 homolog n=1 Tax=Pristis pectinata TaxID=685728 RepID=UPI00223D1920|nr:spermatogenesis-associated protein 7 homolog [Pristis pectinata]